MALASSNSSQGWVLNLNPSYATDEGVSHPIKKRHNSIASARGMTKKLKIWVLYATE
ncbi:MAG: hypothetical protein LRZ84_08380 [Desertifilum sp.]|nr:hypothetical protein [Desertifilum sp.]